LLSFVSPCVLPLIPSYISYITGLSIEQLTDSTVRSKFKKKPLSSTPCCFIAGFSAVFVSFGRVGQLHRTGLDCLSRSHSTDRRILIVIFGLYLLGS